MTDEPVGKKKKKKKIGNKKRAPVSLPIIGWRERVDLPTLGIVGLKAKVDTGARTSALHVNRVSPFIRPDGSHWLRLQIPIERSDKSTRVITREVPSAGMRRVKSSTGHGENRHVVATTIVLGDMMWLVEITLTDRADMIFPMLLGRSALRGRFFIHPARSFLQSHRSLSHR